MKLVGSNPKNKGGSDVSKITPIIGVNIIEIVIDIDTLLFNLQNTCPYSKSIFERCSFMIDERMKESLKYLEKTRR